MLLFLPKKITEYLGNFVKLTISVFNLDKILNHFILDNLCLLSPQKHSHNHIIFQVIEGWANRNRIIQIIPVDIAVRIHIPRIVTIA